MLEVWEDEGGGSGQFRGRIELAELAMVLEDGRVRFEKEPEGIPPLGVGPP